MVAEDPAGAEHYYRQAIDSNPKHAFSHYSLAVLLHLFDLLLHRDDRNLAMGRALIPHRDGLGTSPPRQGATPAASAP